MKEIFEILSEKGLLCMSVRGTVYLYWKTNPEWYDYDENEKEYLTDKAPKEAKESFEKYLALRQKEKETGTKIF
ncbi:MAG: hypothetical protein ACI4M3_01340 [Acutalibacteraceae bacterium]